MSLPQTSYDELPYTSTPMAYAQPERLATLAKVFGMQTPAVAKARVLELGCADGINLITTAQHFPETECIGVDLSTQQINAGQAMIDSLGLKNITFKQANLLELDASLGKFDYIIAHGIYSWVPAVVQEKILSLCKELLNPTGVAYVSYNTKPGWNMRSAIRDMMLYHTGKIQDPKARVSQLRALLKFLADSSSTGQDSYSLFLKEECNTFVELPEAYLFHEFLEEENQPLYFHEFIQQARAHDLEYLSDAFLHSMLSVNFPPEVQKTLQLFQNDLIQQEQYMDFLRNRHFRHSLLCHKGTVLNRALNASIFKDFYISANLEQVSDDGRVLQFKNQRGTVSTERPLLKVMLKLLSTQWPQLLSFSDLVEQSRKLHGKSSPEDETEIAEMLLMCYSRGIIELHTEAQKFITHVSERPCTTALVRLLMTQGNHVVNLRCEYFKIENTVCLQILPYLDGKHTHADLLGLLKQWLNEGKLGFASQQARTDNPFSLTTEQATSILQQSLDEALQLIAAAALLIA
jgi:methyltransferase-like protein/2-polyprenyl-3-methyl-5-hydroxy-6-metoxy-1,4-benzoquinol methylase